MISGYDDINGFNTTIPGGEVLSKVRLSLARCMPCILNVTTLHKAI